MRGSHRQRGTKDRGGPIGSNGSRSMMAHGRLKSVDVSAARSRPGVIAVYTAADLGDYNTPGPILVPPPPVPGHTFHACTERVLASDKVRYVGEPVAMIVAESRYLAEDALAADCPADLAAAGVPWAAPGSQHRVVALSTTVVSGRRITVGNPRPAPGT